MHQYCYAGLLLLCLLYFLYFYLRENAVVESLVTIHRVKRKSKDMIRKDYAELWAVVWGY